MKEEEEVLDYKMYGMVNFQLSPMQAGIQFGHATDEYAGKVIAALLKSPNEKSDFTKNYIRWNSENKTVVVLNGGSTNTDHNNFGTLNQYYEKVRTLNVYATPFYEPTLGNQMTSFAFLLSEKVYDKVKYPDFVFRSNQLDRSNPILSTDEREEWSEWVKSIGIQNNTMREFIRPFQLAR
jgi:hypothetical protein